MTIIFSITEFLISDGVCVMALLILLGGGDYSESERKAILKKRRQRNSIYNKQHFDEILDKNKITLTTLSYDKDRTKNTDMFFATHDIFDKHQYNALFNRKIPKDVTDERGNVIGTEYILKYRIDNSIKNDIKVASEDSSAKEFIKLYNKDRDFYNFVVDRMKNYFQEDRYKFKGYREAKQTLDKINKKNYTPTSNDLQMIYRMFNYIIPYNGEERGGKDVLTQRTKFFNECKKDGYGAILDVNDAIYGGFKAKSPVIVFDMEQIIPKNITNTKMSEKQFSKLMLFGRKALGL